MVTTTGTQNIGQGADLQFTASVAGTTNQAVNWFPVAGNGGAGSGQFDTAPANAGLYYAPEPGTATSATPTITAVAPFDPTQQSPPTKMKVLSSDPLGTGASFTNLNPRPEKGRAPPRNT